MTLIRVLLLGLVAACSINHRSGEFTCDTQSDCASDRVCQQGFCVVTGNNPGDDGGIDPPVDGPPGFRCPAQCTSCMEATRTCRVDCGLAVGAAVCNQAIACPEGFNCVILCTRNSTNGNQQCQQKIDCTAGASCDVTCSGTNTCKSVVCGEGPCEVTCSGQGSCGQVDCDDSCACDVECEFGSSCQNVSCPGNVGQCNRFGQFGCDSNRAGCNTCGQ